MEGPQWAPILRMMAGWPCSQLNRPISCRMWSAAAMVDREEGATETFAEAGLQFRALYKAGEFLKD